MTWKNAIIVILVAICLAATLLVAAIEKIDIGELQSKINTLNASHTADQSSIENLQTEIAVLDDTKLGKPDYDSFTEFGGWKPLAIYNWTDFHHQLNTTNIIVYVLGYDNETQTVHHHWYGGYSNPTWVLPSHGIWWKSNNNTLQVYRHQNDEEWDQGRALIWKIPK